MNTAAQDEWEEIAACVRGQLRKAVALMPAMSPAEMKTFVETMREALYLDTCAATFDDAIEREHAKRAFGD